MRPNSLYIILWSYYRGEKIFLLAALEAEILRKKVRTLEAYAAHIKYHRAVAQTPKRGELAKDSVVISISQVDLNAKAAAVCKNHRYKQWHLFNNRYVWITKTN